MNRNVFIFVLFAMGSLFVLQHVYLGTFIWEDEACQYTEFMGEEPARLSSETFASYLERCPFPVVVNFSARWSENGAAMDERFKQLQKRNYGRVSVCIVDIDENPELASMYNIHSVPQILYFCEGESIKLQTDDGSDAETEPQIELFLKRCRNG